MKPSRLAIGLAITAIVAFVAPAVGMGTASGAATNSAASCDTPFNPWTATATCLAAHGYHSIAPTGRQTLPGGGYEYIYTQGGHQTDYPVPPPGFQPLSASNTLLRTYGFPTRPRSPKQLPAWVSAMRAYRSTVPVPHLVRRTAPGHLTAAPTASTIWAGYVNIGTSGTYSAVATDLSQPNLYPTRCSTDTWVGWVGLGGYLGTVALGDTLLQDGFGATTPALPVSDALSNPTTSHGAEAWWEFYPTVGIQPLPIYSSPSDTLLMSTRVTPTNSGVVVFFLENATDGKTTSGRDNVGTSATTAAGASAEVIDERSTLQYTTGKEVRTQLRRFTGDRWFNGQVASGVTGTVVDPAETEASNTITMRTGTTTLAIPSYPPVLNTNNNSSGFTDLWYACH